MIHIGLTGWGDHPSLYPSLSSKTKLIDYSKHFSIVELDSTFYAIQSEKMIRKWIEETPDDFQFIVKAYQGMTGHHRGKLPYESAEEMYRLFKLSVEPMVEAGKLAMVLVQFPPWFDCRRENVEQIRFVYEQLQPLPVAIEFRHQSWYSPAYQEKSLQFLRDLPAIHSVCDEPQAGEGSIPLVPIATADQVLFRLHGRNEAGWVNTTGDDKEWRKVRYLYEYNEEELRSLREVIEHLDKQAKDVFVIFNNNSGKHAAKNAKQMESLLGMDTGRQVSEQLDIFGEEL